VADAVIEAEKRYGGAAWSSAIQLWRKHCATREQGILLRPCSGVRHNFCCG